MCFAFFGIVRIISAKDEVVKQKNSPSDTSLGATVHLALGRSLALTVCIFGPVAVSALEGRTSESSRWRIIITVKIQDQHL